MNSENTLTTNEAGGSAYTLSAKSALARFAATGTLSNTYYASTEDQMATLKSLLSQVEPEFIAKTAIYSRQSAYLKDMPAMLLAYLSTKDMDLTAKIFTKVVDNPKMLKTFVKMIRSGEFGRKSFGTRLKRLIQDYLTGLTDEEVFRGSIGNNPSMKDIIHLTHPKPATESRKALYGYLIGAFNEEELAQFKSKKGNENKTPSFYSTNKLPSLVKEYETFKSAPAGMLLPPSLSFEQLTAVSLTSPQWKEIAKKATWKQTLKNLNTFKRHGVYEDQSIVELLAKRLADQTLVLKNKAFPFELLAAHQAATDIPQELKDALSTAMEYATKSVPAFEGKIKICLGVSGSMSMPITGSDNRGKVSTISCGTVAALFAACLYRHNPDSEVVAFDDRMVDLSNKNLSRDDSVFQLTQKLGFNRGGTNVAAPLELFNQRNDTAEMVIVISDQESQGRRGFLEGTGAYQAWETFKTRNPNARLVAIDLAASGTSQFKTQEDTLFVGGFSDNVFKVIDEFYRTGFKSEVFVNQIERVVI